MLSSPRNRQLPPFHRRVLSSNLEDHDLGHRIYRALLSLFSDNVNSLMKKHQDCLHDLQEHPRIRVAPEQTKYLESGLKDICQKHMARLSKESLYRNSTIRKAYEDFSKEYKPMADTLRQQEIQAKSFISFKTPKKDHSKLKSFPLKIETDHLRYCKRTRKFSFNNEPTLQPISQRSKVSQNNTTNFICKVSQFKAFESQQVVIATTNSVERVKTSYERQTVTSRIRKGSCHIKTTQERENQENKDYGGIIGEEVVISEAVNQEEEDWEIQQSQESHHFQRPMKTFYTPRVFALRNRVQNPETSLPRMDLLKKTKNHWMSVVQPQGYKPRSKQLTKILAVK